MKPEPLIDENVSAMRSVTMPTVRSVMKDRLTSRIACANLAGGNGKIVSTGGRKAAVWIILRTVLVGMPFARI